MRDIGRVRVKPRSLEELHKVLEELRETAWIEDALVVVVVDERLAGGGPTVTSYAALYFAPWRPLAKPEARTVKVHRLECGIELSISCTQVVEELVRAGFRVVELGR